MRDFIRGYFDGDGCISPSSRRKERECSVSFVGTVNFLDGIRREIGLPSRKYQPEGNAFSLKYGGVVIPLKILNYMYSNAEVYLERKYNRYKKFLEIRDEVDRNKLMMQKEKEEKYQFAATLFKEGKSIRKINSLLKISRQCLSFWLKSNGDSINLSRPFTVKEVKHRNKQEEQVIVLYNKGYSITQIKKNLGMNFYTIKEIITKVNNTSNTYFQ